MTDFDIRAAIREVVETSDLTDPGEIATKVAGQIPAKELRGVLTVVLREYVRTDLHFFRSWRTSKARESIEEVPAEQPGGRPKFRSAKVAAHQAAARDWDRLLRQPVAVEAHLWKHFGDCTRIDIQFLSANRSELAAQNAAAAGRFDRYDAAMEEHGVDRVADLPDAVIASIEDGQQ